VGHHSVRSSARLVRGLIGATVIALVAAGVAFAVSRPGARPRLAAAPSTFTTPSLTSPAVPPVSRKSRPPLTTTPRTTHRPAAAPSPCRTSTDPQRVIVSIAKQHAWICAGTHQVRDSAVTTGMTSAGGTPTGTWHVQAKQTDRWLASGGESYEVKYWMPYDGDYGFHDALWQKFPFGGPQYRTSGSHGCVHFPLTTMAWLYGWTQVGATVTVAA
jgi:lipoprotein-anchoring transpeptidase ErfK/SrfK